MDGHQNASNGCWLWVVGYKIIKNILLIYIFEFFCNYYVENLKRPREEVGLCQNSVRALDNLKGGCHILGGVQSLRGLSSLQSRAGVTNSFCKGPESKYFRLSGPYGLCGNHSVLSSHLGRSHQ